MSVRRAFMLAPLLVAACVAERSPPPAVQAAPPPVALAPPAPAAADWRDAPETPGGWRYVADAAGSTARYGRGASPEFELRCEWATRTVRLSRLGGAAGAMTVRTSYGERAWPAQAGDGRTVITIPATDPFLDQLAFSRGRFSVAVEGLPLLILPAWAEPSRVIEECRAP